MAEVVIILDKYVKFQNVNPVLLKGQFGYEEDFKRLKIGDGVNRYKDLPYFGTTANLSNYYTKSEINTMITAINAAITALSTTVNNLESAVTNIQGDISTIQGDITTINGILSSIQNDILSLQASADDAFIYALIF